MTEDEIVQLGLDAEYLLNDERFLSLYRLVGQRIAAQFLSVPFERKDEIADLHLQKCGYDYLEQQLRQFKFAKDEIEAKREAENAGLPIIDFD